MGKKGTSVPTKNKVNQTRASHQGQQKCNSKTSLARGSCRLSASQELHTAASFNSKAEQLVFPASYWCWFLRSHHHTKQKFE